MGVGGQKSVTHVSSSVELDRLLDADEGRVVSLGLEIRLLLEEAVEILHVGPVAWR